MKKFHSVILAFCFVVAIVLAPALAFADMEIRVSGVVTSISLEKSTFTIDVQNGNSMTFYVNKRSDFEVVVTSTGNDYDTLFTDLKVGDKVHVEAYPSQVDPIADDVKIMR